MPTAGALLVLHGAELVMVRTSPRAPCAVERAAVLSAQPVGGWGQGKDRKLQGTYPRLVGEPPCLGFWETSLKGQRR